jgi:hypothetical protein
MAVLVNDSYLHTQPDTTSLPYRFPFFRTSLLTSKYIGLARAFLLSLEVAIDLFSANH